MKLHTLANTFKIIELLLERGEPMSITELGRLGNIERNAAWRIVSDLCELGYLHKSSYRKVEPGVGLVFLGQAVFSEAFFSNHARIALDDACRTWGISCALGGMLRKHVVYFYRRDISEEAWRWPLYGSNIALTILSVREGAKTAEEILSASVDDANLPPDEAIRWTQEIAANIQHVLDYGYSLQKCGNICNITLPLERGSDIYGLAFYNLPADERNLNTMISECSRLRNQLLYNS